MSYGYGYKNAVSPASTGGYGGVSPFAGGGFGGGFPNAVSPAATMPNMAMPMPMPAMPGMTGMQGMPAVQGMQGMPAMQGTLGVQSPPQVPSGSFITPTGGNIVTVGVEESYVENILRLNRGKMATFYMTYENNREWNAKVFRGIIEAAGRDHIIISDPSTGMRYLLLTLNLDYVTFEGEIAYEYPFQGGTITNTTPLTSREG
ncbi:spore coat protein GerQ [Paenibacillus sp. BK720]|uniref:spore coat protein GerQ n=1 Tax=Paenibacillus sp. BK720 TaxID=2587092 RepID=UPI001FBA249B|nr:spore coat protein GerQ [Paenibacillus sp. BK720]NIK70222.1 spore germination protein Q [Paenibacillus sp. BK720]